MNTRDINTTLQGRKEFYPKDERAGFNLMKSVIKMINALGVNEMEFLSGMLTVITVRIRQAKKERGKDHA